MPAVRGKGSPVTNEEWVKFITGVKELRQSLELSVREVALKLGVRPSHYYNLENEQLKRECDDAQQTLTDIHRWIERNHPDGFIDSQSYSQNLERVADRWYERLDSLERERDQLLEAAKAVVARWETPSWKDTEPTAVVINKLRNVISKVTGEEGE